MFITQHSIFKECSALGENNMKMIEVKWSISKDGHITICREDFDSISTKVGDVIMLPLLSYHSTGNADNFEEFFSERMSKQVEIHAQKY